MQADQKETLSAIGEDLFTLAVDQPFRFPAAFTFVLRAFTTLEGIGRSLDPSFQFSEVAKPYATDLLQLKVSKRSSPAYLGQHSCKAAEFALPCLLLYAMLATCCPLCSNYRKWYG